MNLRATGSMPVEGSSRNTMEGSPMVATATESLRLLPLPDREQLEQRVELRAVADAAPDVGLVVADAEAVDVGLAAGGRELAGQDRESGGLSSAVNT
jgi:hypothetical protein